MAESEVSGGEVTAAVLTGGASLLTTGLSRKEKHAEAHCENCGNSWYFWPLSQRDGIGEQPSNKGIQRTRFARS